MPRRPIYPLANLALGGDLAERLKAWREGDNLTFDAIARELFRLGVDVSDETVRTWCKDLGITRPLPETEAA